MTTPEAQTEALLNEWMVLARHNKRVHEEASSYFRKWADVSMISSIVMGSTSSLLNIVLGAIEPVNLVVVNLSQIMLGITGLGKTVIVKLSKQMELDANAIHHSAYAMRYSELHRLIRAELVLLRMNDSSYASSTDFLKTCAAELNRIEESAPNVPEHVSKRLGAKCTCSPAPSPPRRDSTVYSTV